MADENWQQIRKIFDDALRQKPEERARFVNESCSGDQIVRMEVESLLASFDSAESFMETPAISKVADRILMNSQRFTDGQFLVHYKITRPIGAGGMGEVYLAFDTKLNRKVALKVLHPDLSTDNRANVRLLREAQAAALLEHPNICTIYEISETENGSFIVMQYVEGETLAELLVNERLSTTRSLDLAIQITEALAEAHSHGMIHRDIKPANIIVNEKGHAKVLDFGLAKFIEAQTSEESVHRLNSSGAVMGTVPFMSPEQLRGKQLDVRTDIFSFGALFYEMLTGHQAFGKENNAETISAILNDEPDWNWISLALQPILRKSLMKNKDLRYSSAQDLAEDLRDLQKHGEFAEPYQAETVSTSPTEGVITNEPPRPKKRQYYFWQSSEQKNRAESETKTFANQLTLKTETVQRNYLSVPFAIIILLVIGAAALLGWQFYKKADDSHSFDNLRSVRLVSWKTGGGSIDNDYRISHDGKMLAYSSAQNGTNETIFVKQTTDGSEIRVTKDEWENITPIWSPDDQLIAFASLREGKFGIYSIPAFGGNAVLLKITDEKSFISLRHWSKDGAAIFYELDGNLFRLDIADQEVTQITNFATVKGERRYFCISPYEDKIVYVDRTDGHADLWMSTITGGSPVRLTNDKDTETQPRWHTDGERILYTVLRNNYYQINAAYTDGRSPRQVIRGESEYRLIDVSGDGTKIYYHSRENKSDIWGVKTDTREEFETASGIESEFWADVSPDGAAITYQTLSTAQVFSFSGDLSIIVKSLTNQFPPFSVKGFNPRFLPDNSRIAFLRYDETQRKFELRLVNIINGEEKQVTATGANAPGYSFLPYNRQQTREYNFTPDSRQIVYLGKESGFSNIFIFSPESGETVNITKNTNPNIFYMCPLVSPDGKRIVFVSRQIPASNDEKMVWKILIATQDQTKEIYSTTTSLRSLGWTANGEIILEKSDAPMVSSPLDITLLRLSAAGEKRFETVLKNIYVMSMSLSADGKTVVFTARQDDKDNICVASTENGKIKKIISNSNSKLFYGSPILSPDGKTIFFDKQEETNIISMMENFN
ncbi:hypothetical protein BH10ACI1_BH10ACI1_18330 [soil metagenome]